MLLQLWLLLIIPVISSDERLKRFVFWVLLQLLLLNLWKTQTVECSEMKTCYRTTLKESKVHCLSLYALFTCISDSASNPKHSQVYSPTLDFSLLSNSISFNAF